MSNHEVSDQEIAMILPILQRLVWSDPDTRKKVQDAGINILPCNYYSSTPSVEEIRTSFEYTTDQPPYLNSKIFDKNLLMPVLENLIEFSTEFDPPVEGDEENCQRFFWGNSQFSYSDAMSYYCFVRHLSPSTIIEIGSGFSTLVAIEGIEKNGMGSIICLEPFPRQFLREQNVDLRCIKAQEIQIEFLNDTLQDGDILFIDSTHTVKSGSDYVHIYLRLLPEIKRNIYIHVHDVFLPFGLPQDWLLNRQIFWTEQYLLLAFLTDNPKASLIYGSSFNSKYYPELMKKFMAEKYGMGGRSIWVKYNKNTELRNN